MDDGKKVEAEEEEEEKAEEEEQLQRVSENQIITEEYKTWKKNAPFLYDLIITHALEWPSLTVQWLPEVYNFPGSDYFVQKIVLGTHTSEGEQNHLMIADVQLPLEQADFDARRFPQDRSELGAAFGRSPTKVHISKIINHDGEVNRARYMPQKPSVIATKTVSADIYLFHTNRHPSKPSSTGGSPDLVLKGHSAEGYGLSWSPFKEGCLLSGSNDSCLCLWDINATPRHKVLGAQQIYKIHEGAVEDVDWNSRNENLFGSVGDDRYLFIWDLRVQQANKPAQSIAAHEGDVNCVAFNPFNEMVLATGSADKTIKLFDMRKLTTSLHTLDFHKEEVFQIGWSPKNEDILASCGFGRRLMVWDLSRIDADQDPNDAEDGPPELLFIHGGHTDRISDFSWNLTEDWIIASVAEDNILQIWQMTDQIYLDDN